MVLGLGGMVGESDFFVTFDKIVRWITPLLVAIISLSIFIYKSKVKELEQKLDEEKERRKELVKEIMESFKNYKDEKKNADKELLQYVTDLIKEERKWKSDMEAKQGSHVSIMIDKIEDLNVCVNRTSDKIENYMYSQEKICAERHKWSGQERRSNRTT